MLKVEAVTHAYNGGEPVLQDVGFVVATGDKVVLLGANGSGKSTLLKILNGLVTPNQGRCIYKGTELTKSALRAPAFAKTFRREVALLFQNPDAMIFNPTVFDEIAFGPRQLGAEDIDGVVARWAGLFGVSRHLRRAPFELSRGEKQKVCLAALLAVEPELLLLDEPTANLDPRSTGWLVDFLLDLEVTTVVTTHNLSLAAELGDRTLVLSEAHRLIYDGEMKTLLADTDKLVEANLVHVHRHKHDGVEHRHFHAHDWD
jgi:cobalt/nickel transport system ATP-binding protein